jgi:interleukin-1 receptor-associated kinase 1
MSEPVTWSYDSSAFRVSGADNRLTVLGCNAFAYMDSRDGAVENRYVLGCRAVCSGGGAPTTSSSLGNANGSCDGTGGCCQAPIPPGIRSFEVGFFDDYKNDTSAVAGFSPCSYVVLAEAAAFEFRSSYVTTRELEDPAAGWQVPVVLDWAVGNRTCKEAQRNTTAYACASANSECLDSNNGSGYRCSCSKGYQGNPYLVDGCQGQFSNCFFIQFLRLFKILVKIC